MKSRTSDWFETKIRYDKTQEDGGQKPVTEQYVVDALSFTEAEKALIEEMQTYISGDYKITGIKPAPYHEIFFSDLNADDKWYKAKLQFITIDEKTQKEKRSNVNYLVQAGSLSKAVKYVISAINETPTMDVFVHDLDPDKKKNAEEDKPEYERENASADDNKAKEE